MRHNPEALDPGVASTFQDDPKHSRPPGISSRPDDSFTPPITNPRSSWSRGPDQCLAFDSPVALSALA